MGTDFKEAKGSRELLIGLMSAVAIGIGALTIALPNPIDDAGFFFRYAAHAGAGEGFTFNPGAVPTLGVSSPLWCGLLAIAAGMGFPPDQAHLPLGIALTAFAGGLLCWASARRWGFAAALAVCLLLLSNGRFLLWASAGMESPLGFLLVALGLSWALTDRLGPLRGGLLAGLCILHKLDMGAFALGLLWVVRPHGESRSLKATGKAMAVAAVLVGAYALWAWDRFGSPLPLSVARKLGRDHGAIEVLWFLREALFSDGGPWYCALAIIGIVKLGWRNPVVFLALLHIVSHGLAYSLRPPAEPYSWYPAQLQPPLTLLAAHGLYGLTHAIAARLSNHKAEKGILVGLLLIAGVGLWSENKRYRRGQHAWSFLVESHRIAAGNWLFENTPADARIATGFGLPAYFSERYVHDWSGLTQVLPEDKSFYRATNPDFIATCEFQTGVTPEDFETPAGYQPLQFFGPTAIPGESIDFFMVVLGRVSPDE